MKGKVKKDYAGPDRQRLIEAARKQLADESQADPKLRQELDRARTYRFFGASQRKH
ncbi:hypothetical protein [Thiomonas sp.]